MSRKTIRKRFDLSTIDIADKTVRDEFELDKHAVLITGFVLTADLDDQLYHRGTIGITVNGEEVLPDLYHAKLVMSGLAVPPKDRYLPFAIEPGNGIIKTEFTDYTNPAQAFAEYNPSLYVEYQIETDAD